MKGAMSTGASLNCWHRWFSVMSWSPRWCPDGELVDDCGGTSYAAVASVLLLLLRGVVMTSAATPDRVQLSREFHEATLEGYRFLVRSIGYKAKAFLNMVVMNGGEDTAHALLRALVVSDGFERLRRENMLQHSIEALVLNPHYAELFAEHEVEIAQTRLIAVGFDVEEYLRRLSTQ
jgi:hypothetical protein